MRIWLKISLTFSIIVISIAIFGYIAVYQLNAITEPFKAEIPNNIEKIQNTSILNGYAQSIKYYDEVLTQSVRNYAFTQDKKWEERYRIADPALDLIIQDAIKKGDVKDAVFFSKVNDANIALLKMEHTSLDLIDQGHKDDAIKILESKEYSDQKKIYQQGLMDYVARHESDYNKALEANTLELDKITTNTLDLIKNYTNMLSIFIITALVLSIIAGFIIVHGISRPISNLREVTNKIANGDFSTKISVTGNDEINDLSNDINIMSVKLREYNTNLIKSERLSAIGEMAARLAHDLKNPLSVLRNTIEIFQIKYSNNSLDSASFNTHCTKIDNAVSRISHQINDVLDFVRISPLNLSKVSLLPFVRNICKKIPHSKNIEIELPNNYCIITADEKKLEVVLTNLLVNAVEAIGDKLGKITIRFIKTDENIKIEITDTGPGIPEDIKDKIFEPLFTTKQKGTGLGLVSCKNIIEQHGGTIIIQNNPTTFTVLLPMIQINSEIKTKPQ